MIILTRSGENVPEDERRVVLNIDHIISVCKHQGCTTVCVTGLLPGEFPWHVTETVPDVFTMIRQARAARRD